MTELFVFVVTLGHSCTQLLCQSEATFNELSLAQEIWCDTVFVSLSHSTSLPLKTAQLKCLTKHKDYF